MQVSTGVPGVSGVRSPGARVTGGYGRNVGLQEQNAALTPEPSLQPKPFPYLNFFLLVCMLYWVECVQGM